MTKFIVASWLILLGLVASSQIFDFWRIEPGEGAKMATFCEGTSCRSDRYSARVFYIYGDVDRVLIRDSAAIELGCGTEKATHLKARSLELGGSAEGVRGQPYFDRASQRSQVVNELGVFLPCDAPADASAFGIAVAFPVWVTQALSNMRSTLGVSAAKFDVTH